jgi:two-component system NtrC family sensor kinase
MSDERLLVVDDEVEILELLKDVLSGAGYQVDGAPDARSALDLIRDHIYDAAIVDFNLPDMDGVMLHRQIRQMDSDLANKTIFMSGLVQNDSNLDYYAAAGGGFLAKPFDVQMVVQAVQNVIAGIVGEDGES